MSERSMRDTMRKHFKADFKEKCHWQRIEADSGLGIPDIYACVNGVRFWIEAKQVDQEKLPKRSSTPVRIGLTDVQALWLDEELLAGGICFVVAKIWNEWFVFDNNFFAIAKGMTLSQLRFIAASNWSGPFDTNRIVQLFCKQGK